MQSGIWSGAKLKGSPSCTARPISARGSSAKKANRKRCQCGEALGTPPRGMQYLQPRRAPGRLFSQNHPCPGECSKTNARTALSLRLSRARVLPGKRVCERKEVIMRVQETQPQDTVGAGSTSSAPHSGSPTQG